MSQIKFLKIDDTGFNAEMDTANDQITLASMQTAGATMDVNGITIPTGKAIEITDAPSAGNHAVNRDYVQTYVQGLDPQESVLSKTIGTPPGSPSIGNRYIIDATGNNVITGVTTGTKTFTVAGDQTANYNADDIIKIRESTGNNGWYTVVSSTFDTDHTDIVVEEVIIDATVDGIIYYATGLWAVIGVDKIVQWDGVNWNATIPTFGFNTYVEDEIITYVYSTSHMWVTLVSALQHNNLAGKQGGTTNEYYHMTNAEDTWLAGAIVKVGTPSNIADLTDNDVITGNWSLGSGGEMDCSLGEFTFPNAVSASPSVRDSYVDGNGYLYVYDGTNWKKIGESGDPVKTSYTGGEANMQYKVVRISANDTVIKAQADSLVNAKGTIGICIDNKALGQSVDVQENGVVTGILSGATAGTPYFLSGTVAGVLVTTPPNGSGNTVLMIGYAKNSTDFAVKIETIKVRG